MGSDYQGRARDVLVYRREPQGPAGVALTDDDRALLFNSLVAQSGTYKLEGAKVLIHYDGSAAPSLTGQNAHILRKSVVISLRPRRSSSFTTAYDAGQIGQDIIAIRTFERVE